MVVTVVNKYKEPNHIYCGRGSPVGNPYPITKNQDRDAVCDAYEVWFKDKMEQKHNEVTNFVNELVTKATVHGINLGCFCAPKRCHCDTIKTYIDNKLKGNK